MKNRATRVPSETKIERRKRPISLILTGAALILLVEGLLVTFLSRGRDSALSRIPASVPPATAHFSYARSSDLGDRISSSINCPGTRLCSVEIRENGQIVAKAETTWETIQPFFVHYATSPLIKTPLTSAAHPARTLATYTFRMGTLDMAGVISDQSQFRRVLPYWDAMFLGFL